MAQRDTLQIAFCLQPQNLEVNVVLDEGLRILASPDRSSHTLMGCIYPPVRY